MFFIPNCCTWDYENIVRGVWLITSWDLQWLLDDGTRYKISKNIMVMPNVDYIHIYGKDEYWKRTNRDEMILENFLAEDEDGWIRFLMNESFISVWCW